MRTRLISSSSDSVPSAVEHRSGKEGHQSVLLQEAITGLAIASDDTVVDATLGGAGHARAIARRLGPDGIFIGLDLDSDAIARAEESLHDAAPHTFCIQANFRDVEAQLRERGITAIDKALFDLGWSSYQLAAGRGFSFLTDEPLLMTYSSSSGSNEKANVLTAATIVNTWEESSLADIIFGWGEERYSRRIARAIVAQREVKPFTTAHELATAIKDSVPGSYRTGRLHPATRTFQALRIAVNDELGALKEGLAGAWNVLNPGGRIAVITFHSIEDRIVKELFLEWQRQGGGTRITRSPIRPAREELLSNPRSRSAKLRIIEKSQAPKD